jgi:hypothetical protein
MGYVFSKYLPQILLATLLSLAFDTELPERRCSTQAHRLSSGRYKMAGSDPATGTVPGRDEFFFEKRE